MTDLMTGLWEGLRDAGLPEVMLFMADGTASRCHWDQTVMVGEVRVALLGDQERNVVRVVPIRDCAGIGLASPKGTDTSTFRSIVRARLVEQFSPEVPSA